MKDTTEELPIALLTEKAVLGTMIYNYRVIPKVLQMVSVDSFASHVHKDVFKAIKNLSDTSAPIDIVSVQQRLQQQGSKVRPVELAGILPKANSGEIENNCLYLIEQQVKRELRQLSLSISEKTDSEKDIFDMIGFVTSEITRINSITNLDKGIKFSDMVREIERDIELAENILDITGVETPFELINKRFGGWQEPDLIIIAARPGMGKTAWALQLATHPVFHNGSRVLFFSLEMSYKQLTARVLSQETGIWVNRFTRDAARMNKDELTAKLGSKQYVYNDNLEIDDTGGMDISRIKNKAKTVHMELPLNMIVIDYLQLVRDSSVRGNREEEISNISRKLKELAKELQIPVIALSQLNRDVEKRGGSMRPKLSDLRESGAIEQDADIVIFLHRPEYYGITEDEEGNSLVGKAEIITAKYRNGDPATDILNWDGRCVRFSDSQSEHHSSDRFTEISITTEDLRNDNPF